jgi:hypothetical protein
MDEGKKSNEKGRKEHGTSGEKPDNKEGAVDDEEGGESTDINGREREAAERPFRKYEEHGKCDGENSDNKETRNDDETEEVSSEGEKDNGSKRMKEEKGRGKEDEEERFVDSDAKGDCRDKRVIELTVREVVKDVTGNEMSGEVLQVADGKAHETGAEEVIDKDKTDLKKFPVKLLPPEDGSVQLETADCTGSKNNQDSVAYKEESYRNTEEGSDNTMASGNKVCGKYDNQVRSWKEIVTSEQSKKRKEVLKTVEYPREEAMDETEVQLITDIVMQPDSAEHDKDKQEEDVKASENMNKELKESEVLTEVKDEKPDKENAVMNQESKMDDDRAVTAFNSKMEDYRAVTAFNSKMEDDRAVTAFNNTMQDRADVAGSVDVSSVSNGICNAQQQEAQEQELSFISMNKEEMGVTAVTEEKENKNEAQELSSSIERIKNSVQTETADGKQKPQMTYGIERNKVDKKAKDKTEMKGLSDAEKGRTEEKKEWSDDRRIVDLNHKATSSMIKVTPESVEEVLDCRQEEQTCILKETTDSVNDRYAAKKSNPVTSVIASQLENSYEIDQSQGSLDKSVTEKPICTVFHGTIIRGVKREESIQRSEVKRSSQNQGHSRVKPDNSTEIAINGQLKQLECKIQPCTEERPAPLKPQPLRQQKQMQQTQVQEQTQKQQQVQDQMEPNKQQEKKPPAKQSEQQQQQNTQNMHEKKEKGEIQEKQIEQAQQPLKKKIQMIQKHEEEQCTQKNQQQSMIKEQPEIHNQDNQEEVEQINQRRSQANGNSQQNQQEQKTKKQLHNKIKQENEQQWQQERKCKQQQIESQSEQEIRQQPQSKLQQQEEHKQHQKPKEQQQEPKEMTQKKVEKQRERRKPGQGYHQQQEQHPKQQSAESEDDRAPGCGGTQGRSCPIYFGVKSYLHHFYDSATVKDSQIYEDYTEVSESIALQTPWQVYRKWKLFSFMERERERERCVS